MPRNILTGAEVPIYVDTPNPHPCGYVVMTLTEERDEDTWRWVWVPSNIGAPQIDPAIPACTDNEAVPYPLHGDLYDQRFDIGTLDCCQTEQPTLFE